MRFKLSLAPLSKNQVIPINYQYPLSAVIYKIMARADADYSTFLHQKGFGVGVGLKRFKLFTFSDLTMKFKLRQDRMLVHSDPKLIVSFHLPEAAQHFVKGLFLSQEVDIADKKSKATFRVNTVEALAEPFTVENPEEHVKVHFRPISPCVTGLKNEKGEYNYLSPADARFPLCAEHNWCEKLRSVGLAPPENELKVRVKLLKTEPRSRLMTIKAFTPQQTRIRGYQNFGLEIEGRKKCVQVLYNAGIGVYNAQGMGCVEVEN